jgi:uncharacterized protein (TIGR03067 family)
MCVRVVLLGVVLLLFAALTPGQETNKELEALQGEWKIVSIEPRLEPETSYTITIKGELWTIKAPDILGNAAAKTTIKIDPSKNPKTIDLLTKIGDKERPPQLGIYKLEGNTLTVCQTRGKADRPTEFKSTDRHMLIVLKRTSK